MVKLLAIDLDGTLLNGSRQISAENVAAIQLAKSRGVTVVLASGRIEPSIRPFKEALGLDGPTICANGAHVLGPDGGEILHVGLDQATTQIVLDYARLHRVHLNIYSRSTLTFLHRTPWSEIYLRRVPAVVPSLLQPADLPNMKPTKLMLVDNPEAIALHRSQLADQIDPARSRMALSEPEYLDFLSIDATKGHGLEVLASRCEVAQQDVAAIGDYLNDLEMVEWAGLSAAVANAAPEICRAADVVVSSNDEAGVAQFILEYVLPHSDTPAET